MAWNLCSSEAAIAKAGAHAATIAPASLMDTWSLETEGFINAETRRDWVTANPPNAATSGALSDVASAHIANKIINYDTDDFITLSRAQTTLNVNADIVRKGIAFLKDEDVKENM